MLNRRTVLLLLASAATPFFSYNYRACSEPLQTNPSNDSGHFVLDGPLLSSTEMQKIRLFLRKESTRSEAKEVSKGRFHHNLIDSAPFREEISGVIAKLLPIAMHEMPHCVTKENQLILTEVQIVNSLPSSDAQIWHADNSHKGVTFVIPLTDLTELNTIELLTGTHDPSRKLLANLAHVRPLLKAGKCLVFDARLLHRGGPNRGDTSRPILVLRFDSKVSRPPGMTFVGATLRHYSGLLLSGFCERAMPRHS